MIGFAMQVVKGSSRHRDRIAPTEKNPISWFEFQLDTVGRKSSLKQTKNLSWKSKTAHLQLEQLNRTEPKVVCKFIMIIDVIFRSFFIIKTVFKIIFFFMPTLYNNFQYPFMKDKQNKIFSLRTKLLVSLYFLGQNHQT